jgi:indole-3-glycerol phosphate synthase
MFLDRIVATKKQEVEQLKSVFSLSKAEAEIAGMAPCLGFADKAGRSSNRPMGLIAEVKKASPSKGLIREDFHPVRLAEAYRDAGADCISVLTDKDYFQGSNDYLRAVREAVELPLLRKDFTIDYRQVYEARLLGADAVLLIAAILKPQEMKELLTIARDIGLDALVEVHDRPELERSLELGVPLIGINNRNLHTFVTDIRTTEELIRYVPKEVQVVSESGIGRPEEIGYLQRVGAKAVLIGEHFMRQPDVGQAVIDLLGPVTEGKR